MSVNLLRAESKLPRRACDMFACMYKENDTAKKLNERPTKSRHDDHARSNVMASQTLRIGVCSSSLE